MEGPGITKAAVDRLRERAEQAERTFDAVVSRQRGAALVWREWKNARDASSKAALYERLRTIALAHPSLGGLVISRENAIEDYERAAASLARSA